MERPSTVADSNVAGLNVVVVLEVVVVSVSSVWYRARPAATVRLPAPWPPTTIIILRDSIFLILEEIFNLGLERTKIQAHSEHSICLLCVFFSLILCYAQDVTRVSSDLAQNLTG